MTRSLIQPCLTCLLLLTALLTFCGSTQTQAQEAQVQSVFDQPIQTQQFYVPQQLYQEYNQTTTVTPGRQYMVPQQYYRRSPLPPRPRGVWGWGPFPMGYYY